MNLEISTNNVPRDILYWHELTDEERAEFDYLDTEDRQQDATFFRYRGSVYDLGEFLVLPGSLIRERPEIAKWSGYMSESYFFGLLVRYVDDFERVVVGYYTS